MPLADAVTRLLTRRLQHRRYIADGQTAQALIEGNPMDCYRCKKEFGIWNLSFVTVHGTCGQVGERGRHGDVFAPTRPEAQPAIRAAGERLCTTQGWTPARLGSRRTQTSGTTYMAFICPHCNATCGDMFVHHAFLGYDNTASIECDIPATAVTHPHWCVAGDTGCCPIPPASVIEELTIDDQADDGDDTNVYGSVTVTRVGGEGGISINQAVSRLFGGY